MTPVTACPGCGASINSTTDVDFVQLDEADTGWTLRTPKKMYVVACGKCEAVLGGGVAGGG